MNRLLRLTSAVLILIAAPLWAQVNCHQVGGVLMTNVGAIAGEANLGPVFGDLAGAVAATQVNTNPIQYQHYWVTASGDTITFAPATLNAVYVADGVYGVPWGGYRSVITGGTGRFKKATGFLDYFGIADFNAPKKGTDGTKAWTLVLRYSGQVCYDERDYK